MWASHPGQAVERSTPAPVVTRWTRRRRWGRAAAIGGWLALVVGACSTGESGLTTATSVRRAPTASVTEPDPVTNVVERDSALTSMREHVSLLERGDWAGAWATLHPTQQQLVDQASFASCAQRRWGQALDVTEVHVTSIRGGTFGVPGTAEEGSGFRIEVRVVGRDAGGPFDAPSTFIEVKVAETWRWTVRDPAAYQADRCPADDDALT